MIKQDFKQTIESIITTIFIIVEMDDMIIIIHFSK